MFCTKCGKELYDGDRFCAYCGAQVRALRVERTEESTFTPPFKAEAQRRNEDLFRATENVSNEQPRQVRRAEPVSFDWNLDGFPGQQPRKTEAVDFNWDSVVERKSRGLSPVPEPAEKETRVIEPISQSPWSSVNGINANVNTQQPKQTAEARTEQPTFSWDIPSQKTENVSWEAPSQKAEPISWDIPRQKAEPINWDIPSQKAAKDDELEDVLSIDDLEKELFDLDEPLEVPAATIVANRQNREQSVKPAQSAPSAQVQTQESTPAEEARDPRFYTFNKKTDEFQELLEKEKARVKALEDEYNRQLTEMDYTWVPEVLPPRVRNEIKFGAVSAEPKVEPAAVVEPEPVEEPVVEAEPEPAAEIKPEPVTETVQAIELEKPIAAEPSDEPAEPAEPVDEAKQEFEWAQLIEKVNSEATPEPTPATPIFVGVCQPAMTMAIDAITESTVEPIAETIAEPAAEPVAEATAEAETAEEATPSSDKLRYSDVFPRIDKETERAAAEADAKSAVPATDGSENKTESAGEPEAKKPVIFDDGGADYDNIAQKPVKKHIFLKIFVTLLVIALLGEGALLGIKFFLPESEISAKINDITFDIIGLVTGADKQAQEQEQQVADTEKAQRTAYFSQIVQEESADVKTIGTVSYNQDLVYDSEKTYAFEEVTRADEFVDADMQDTDTTYGHKLIASVVNYYDSWIDTNDDESLVGINTLEIGDIRTGQEGLYVLCSVTYAQADGTELTKYQTVYVKITDGLMVINEIKEETI